MSHIVCEELVKHYQLGSTTVQALRGVSLEIRQGEFVALAGPSGSGKTTLLNVLGCIECATTGRLIIDGVDTSRLTDNELSDLRADKISFIFQNFNLLPVLNARENVEYALSRRKAPARAKRILAEKVLDLVGLSQFLKHKPMELSGGQRQRVAIARALVNNPALILADEPTANLDQKTGEGILDLICHINETLQTTIILCTHDPKILPLAERVIQLTDGLIVGREGQPQRWEQRCC